MIVLVFLLCLDCFLAYGFVSLSVSQCVSVNVGDDSNEDYFLSLDQRHQNYHQQPLSRRHQSRFERDTARERISSNDCLNQIFIPLRWGERAKKQQKKKKKINQTTHPDPSNRRLIFFMRKKYKQKSNLKHPPNGKRKVVQWSVSNILPYVRVVVIAILLQSSNSSSSSESSRLQGSFFYFKLVVQLCFDTRRPPKLLRSLQACWCTTLSLDALYHRK